MKGKETTDTILIVRQMQLLQHNFRDKGKKLYLGLMSGMIIE